MVGGAIWGYCAIGSVESAITPTSVITMLITPAKIGRSMKKCGKFICRALSFWRLGFRRARFSSWWCRLRNWFHRHSGLQHLQARGDNFLAVLKPALHDPFAFENGSGLKRAAFNRVIGLHDERIFQALL